MVFFFKVPKYFECFLGTLRSLSPRIRREGVSLFSFTELNNGSNSSKRPYELHSKATQGEHLWEKKFFSMYVFYTPSLLMQEKEKGGGRILGCVTLSPLLHPQSQFKKCWVSHRLKMNSLLPLRGIQGK